MLQNAPFHQEHYARLILMVVDQYYQRCNDRLQSFTKLRDSNADKPTDLRPAAWAQRQEMISVLNTLFTVSSWHRYDLIALTMK